MKLQEFFFHAFIVAKKERMSAKCVDKLYAKIARKGDFILS